MPRGLRIFEKYEIIRRIASGGMGDIFLARQLGIAGFQRLVVLKSLKPEIVEREDVLAMFLNEARTAAKMNHPNIVAVYEIDEFRGVYFIAMELIQGADLRTLYRAAEWHQQRIPYRVSAAIIREAALGLDHAHRAPGEDGEPLSIVHRDVSPQNIMVRLDGVTKVVDFGIAAASALDRRSNVQGKLRYMAPEQAIGLPVDGGADQFSLGIVLWELCTGRRLFDHEDPEAAMMQLAVNPIPPPSTIVPDIPDSLEAVIMRMLERARVDRFQHMGDVAAMLAKAFPQSGGIEQGVARVVRALVGKQVTDVTSNLELEEVNIPGLLEAAEQICLACGEKNPLRNRFCSGCGKALAQVKPAARKTFTGKSSEVPQEARARVVRELLLEEASSLGRMLENEKKDVAVLAASVIGREKLARDLEAPALSMVDRELLDQLTGVAERYGVLVQRMTRDEALLVFGADARAGVDPIRAVECALELSQKIESVSAKLSVAIAVDCGHAQIGGGRGAMSSASGEAIDRAPRLAAIAAASETKGVFVSDPLAQRLEGWVRVATETLSFEGRSISCLRLVSLAPRAFSAEVPLVGRKDELAAIRELVLSAKQGKGGALIFFGAPGSGKTRLLREAGELLRKQDARAKTFSELADDFNVAVMLADAERQTIGLLVDDLHLEDATAFARLEAIAKQSGKLKLAIIATADASRAASLDLAWAAKHDLRPLSDEKMMAVASARLNGAALPPAVAQLLLERGEGSPRTLLLVLDALIDRGGLLRDGDRWAASDTVLYLPLPVRNEDLLLERVEHLSREAKSFLRVAAVAGQAFSAEVVAAALGIAGDRDAGDRDPPALIECVKSGLVYEVLAHPGAYQIADRTLRDLLLARFPDVDLLAVHARLADVLEASSARETAPVLAAIARHRVAARAGITAAEAATRAADALGKTREAGELYLEAVQIYTQELAEHRGSWLDESTAAALNDLATNATRCFAAFDLERAEKMLGAFEGRVKAAMDPTGRAIALAARGTVRLSLGKLELCERDLERAMELAADARLRDVATIVLAQAALWEARGQLGEAADLLKQTIAVAPQGSVLWECSNALGRLYFRMGEIERAARLFEAAIDEASAAGETVGVVRAMINRALASATMKQTAQALAMLDRAEVHADDAGELLERSRIRFNRGRILADRGEREPARAAFERALEDARLVRWSEGIALATQALETT